LVSVVSDCQDLILIYMRRSLSNSILVFWFGFNLIDSFIYESTCLNKQFPPCSWVTGRSRISEL
jgi:hypothetical protein